jgi:hypothetical protein
VKQTSKNLSLLAGLAVVALGLSLYAYFGVMKAEESKEQAQAAADRLFEAAATGEKLPDGGEGPLPYFTTLTVKAKGDTTTLERQADGGWKLTSPVVAPADRAAVEQIVQELGRGKVKSTVEERPTEADLDKYGLAEPHFTLTAQARVPRPGQAPEQGEPKELKLQGGLENPFDGSSYIRKNDDPRVYQVPGATRLALNKSTYELRFKEVLALEQAKVRQLAFRSAKNRYRLARDAAGTWKLLEPVEQPADSAAVTSAVASFTSAQASAFLVDTPEERKAKGFDAPVAEVTFTLEGGETVQMRLARPHGVDAGSKLFALREGPNAPPLLAEVPEAALPYLDKAPSELRDKSVLEVKKEDVAKLSFEAPKQPALVVEKEAVASDAGQEERWMVVAPQKGPAKKFKVSAWLWALSGLKASQLGEDKPKSWAKYGLDKPARTVTLADKDGKILARLLVGKDVPDKAGFVYARGSRDQVVELEASRLAELPQTAADALEGAGPDAGTAARTPG